MTKRGDTLTAAGSLAATQDGAISRQQLRRCGVDARSQRLAVAGGILQIIEPTVLVVVAGSADTWRRQLRVGLLALGPAAWVSHEAAARLHGLEGTQPGLRAFTVMRGRRWVTIRGGVVHTTNFRGPHDVITVDGFRCASATRTILDLAAAGAREQRLATAIDSAIRLRLPAALVLEQRLSERRGA